MNGIHDMGGMQGFGPVVGEADEPPFHASWEGRVLALQRAILFTRAWNLDQFRYSQERVPASVYLSVSYYHRWFLAIAQSALEKGLVEPEELEAGHAKGPGRQVARTMTQRDVHLGFTRGPFGRTPNCDAQFQPGDRVRTRNLHTTGHTRLPRYARDKVGCVEAINGCHVYPDSAAAGKGEDPQWLYTVVFSGQELWGPEADPAVSVSIDAFEPYLERA